MEHLSTKIAPAIVRASVAASTLGLGTLLMGWFTLRPNRLAGGESFSLMAAVGWESFAAMAALWSVCLVLSLLARRDGLSLVLSIVSGVLPTLVLFLTGLGAQHLSRGASTFSRVSAGGGVWISLLAAYVLIYVSRQRFKANRLLPGLLPFVATVLPLIILASGWLNDLSVVQEVLAQASRFRQETIHHLWLSGVSVAAGTVVGIPLGIWAVRSHRAETPVFFVANVAQTVPSLALFGLLIAPLSAISFAFPVLRDFGIRGIGTTPALIALTIYSLLPIIRNTFVSLRGVDPSTKEAGLGMGMGRFDVFRRIEAPLAAPLVVEGVRIAAVQAIGNTAVAALIGAGGLGFFVFQGLGQGAPDLILAGAIPIVALAIVEDGLMRLIVLAVRPKGLT